MSLAMPIWMKLCLTWTRESEEGVWADAQGVRSGMVVLCEQTEPNTKDFMFCTKTEESLGFLIRYPNNRIVYLFAYDRHSSPFLAPQTPY